MPKLEISLGKIFMNSTYVPYTTVTLAYAGLTKETMQIPFLVDVRALATTEKVIRPFT